MAMKRDRGNERGTELMKGANVNGFSFGIVQLQDVFTHPCLFLLQVGVSGGGCDLKIKFSIISIAMELYSVLDDDTAEGDHVTGE